MAERKNEFGEKITEEELDEFTERIRVLPDEKIDELWHLCGFVMEDRGENKAIREKDLEKIRKGPEDAKEVLWSLLSETKFEEFEKNLVKVEKKTTKVPESGKTSYEDRV